MLHKQRVLFHIALIAFGVNLCFALQEANLSALFKFVGSHDHWLPMIWMIPPLTGLIIQPIVGQMSDNTFSALGKRCPYILFFGLLAAGGFFSLTLFNTFLSVIILNICIDCGLNGSAEGLRALTGDTFREDVMRTKAFALQAVLSSTGALVGVSLPQITHRWHLPLTAGIPGYLQLAFFIAGLLLMTSVIFSLPKLAADNRRHGTKQKIQLPRLIRHSFADLYQHIKQMPKLYRNIFLIHSISWTGIFIFWIYFTLSLTEVKYGIGFNAEMNLVNHQLLQLATLDTSYYFAEYQIVSILFASVLFFANVASRAINVHSIALLIGGIAIASFPWLNSNTAIFIEFIGIGIMWGSMITLPYAIILSYLPRKNLGVYLGVFNVSITAPQVICSLVLGLFVTYFVKSPTQLLLISGCLLMVSAILWILFSIKINKLATANVAMLTDPGAP